MLIWGIICQSYPKYKSENIIPIMYGYPTPETTEAAIAGELKLGGCEVYIHGCDILDKFCKDCEFEWSIVRFIAEDIVKVRFRYWSNWGNIDTEALTEEQWASEEFQMGLLSISRIRGAWWRNR